jgi:hypothetical protein
VDVENHLNHSLRHRGRLPGACFFQVNDDRVSFRQMVAVACRRPCFGGDFSFTESKDVLYLSEARLSVTPFTNAMAGKTLLKEAFGHTDKFRANKVERTDLIRVRVWAKSPEAAKEKLQEGIHDFTQTAQQVHGMDCQVVDPAIKPSRPYSPLKDDWWPRAKQMGRLFSN